MTKSKLKKNLLSLPVIGKLLKVSAGVAHLPSLREQMAKDQAKQAALQSLSLQLTEKIDSLNRKLNTSELVQDNLQQTISLLETNNNMSTAVKSSTKKELFADDHMLDKFYTAFEDRFRGPEKMIMDRQKEYLPYFTKSKKIDFSKTPVLDIGSGRGEFLQLLSKNDIRSVGLDINHDMVNRANEKGLEAIQGDALSHLQSVKSQSYGAVTGFHIVEHIPFNTLLRIIDSTRRSLVNEGFVIFETPNPENLTVGSTTFYMDPSHLHPIPPALLAFTLELSGFRNVEILRIHPNEKLSESKIDKDVAELIYGPRDYAVIGYK
jgi:2-polyprenyl-3-methyl-5-hydroxy-6-metoxy-1,4-benzoquinol methylase